MNTHSNIIAHIPQDLRTNHTTTRGAWRDATRKIAPGASFMETKTTLDALLLDGVKVTNDKGVERLTARIKKVLKGRLLMTRGLKASRRRRGLVATVMTVEPENLQIMDLEIACEPGRGLVWRYEMAGRVSSHAAARYIERCGDPDISLVTIAR